MKKVVIAIQARSTSHRLPRKVYEMIDGKTMLEQVVDRCKEAQRYMNQFTPRTGVAISIAIVCPENDSIATDFRFLRIPIIQGPEQDVLKRYHICAESLDADYIVRVTSDCPMIPNYVISKTIKNAIVNEADYASNVFPEIRTACDGIDCEVISRRAINWMQETAKDMRDREHVTTLLHYKAPRDFVFSHVIGFFQHAHIKLSVDTQEDLERVREEFAKIKKCIDIAKRLPGKHTIHRF